MYTLLSLNQMTQAEFVAAVGGAFEETPTVAATAWQQRPFATIESLHWAMMKVVQGFSSEQQIALIRSHPSLGAKVKMAAASVSEQAGAGLDRLSPRDYALFQQLNHDYEQTFGFPFVLAVKGHTTQTILATFQSRLQNTMEAEQQQALQEIAKISLFRLTDWIQAPE
jgi:2-oxo-4-hydroxy-4-carboxy-5-ureidoimidazoline decarboxylase